MHYNLPSLILSLFIGALAAVRSQSDQTFAFALRSCPSGSRGSLAVTPLVSLKTESIGNQSIDSTFKLEIGQHFGVIVISPDFQGPRRQYLFASARQWFDVLVRTFGRHVVVDVDNAQYRVLFFDVLSQPSQSIYVQVHKRACLYSDVSPDISNMMMGAFQRDTNLWCGRSANNVCTDLTTLKAQNAFFGDGTSTQPGLQQREQCVINVCLNGGTCLLNKEKRTFDCVCPAEYRGDVCELRVTQTDDEKRAQCSAMHCKNGGTCLPSSDGPPVCLCMDGFSGADCSMSPEHAADYDACRTLSCQNGTTCVIRDRWPICEPNGASSSSATGTSGTGVTVPSTTVHTIPVSCAVRPCIHDGVCVPRETAPFYRCECTQGWTGVNCEVDVAECDFFPCLNQGTCLELPGSFKCSCPPGYRGTYCDLEMENACESEPCEQGGTCTSTGPGQFTCACPLAWTGPRCETFQNPCAPNPCLNQGQCKYRIGDETVQCDCPSGFTGSKCEEQSDACAGVRCPHNQQCVAGTCQCAPGLTGPTCTWLAPDASFNTDADNKSCATMKCQNNGQCFMNGTEPECRCTSGFTGRLCEQDVDECSSQHQRSIPVCPPDRVCSNTYGSFECICVPPNCAPGAAVASAARRKPVPATRTNCASRPCLNDGICVNDPQSGYMCLCLNGFAGKRCETAQECIRNPCENGGTCQPARPDGYICMCRDGFLGSQCERTVSRAPGTCTKQCLNGGTCLITAQGKESCSCHRGYSGDSCEIDFPDCEHSPCFNGGTCVEKSDKDAFFAGLLGPSFLYENSHGRICQCPRGTSGESCEFWSPEAASNNSCLPNPCKNQGSCRVDEQEPESFICQCNKGATGPLCEQDINECEVMPDICGPNAVRCVNLIGTYECECAIGWTGPGCYTPMRACDDQPCPSGLQCVPTSDLDYHCRCPLGKLEDENDNCTLSTIAGFVATSALVHISHRPSPTLDLQLSFRTTLSDIAIASGTDALVRDVFALSLMDGFVTVNWQDAKLQLAGVALNDGDWHSIAVKRYEHGLMSVALFAPDTGQVIHKQQLPNTSATFGLFSVKLGDGFIGCVRDVRINNQTLVPSHMTGTAIDISHSCVRVPQCDAQKCANKGKCMDKWNTYSCECSRPYLPPNCAASAEEATFGYELNRSYVAVNMTEQEQQNIEKNTDISMLLRTRQADGSLVYIGSRFSPSTQTFLSVELVNGQLQCNAQFGGDKYTFTGSGLRLDDGNVHLVRVHRETNHIRGYVNDTRVFDGQIPQRHSFLLVELFLIGGYYNVGLTHQQRRKRQISVQDLEVPAINAFSTPATFKGTLQDVRINGKLVTFFPMETSQVRIQQFGRSQLRENVLRGTVSDDMCADAPCEHGACLVTFNDYTCDCAPGWRGRDCNLTDMCAATPPRCPSDKTCENTDRGFLCLSPMTFTAQSGAKFSLSSPIAGQRTIHFHTFEFRVRTRTSDGVLMYAYHMQSSDYVLVYVSNGTLAVNYRLGSPISITNTPAQINDGQWHHIFVSLITESPHIMVDGNESTLALNGRPGVELAQLLQSPAESGVYFGNVPNEAKQLDFTRFGGLTTGIDGCLNDIRFGRPGQLPQLSFYEKDSPGQRHFVLIETKSLRVGCHSQPQCVQHDACLNQGQCIDAWNLRQCDCVPGFDGDRCENNIDDCLQNQCLHKSTCVDGIQNYTCECLKGYEGQFCEHDIDECASNPCRNGAPCSDGIGNYSCDCGSLFVGQACQARKTATCNNRPCENSARCTAPSAGSELSFGCDCPLGYEGILCESPIDYCEPSPCLNGAKCESVNHQGTFQCYCAPGFQGNTCAEDINECEPSPCQNGARCVDGRANYTCLCEPGWTGPVCDQDLDECLSTPCLNSGTCSNKPGDYECMCAPHYYGANCEIEGSCLRNPCGANGNCVQQRNDPQTHYCQCLYGYEGVTCNRIIDFCASNPCLNNGSCSQPFGSIEWSCACVLGFEGTVCEHNIDDCAIRPCQHGKCVDGVNSFECDCSYSGYKGRLCALDIDECEADRQSNEPYYCVRGTCSNREGSYDCFCDKDFIGPRCAHVNPCSLSSANMTDYLTQSSSIKVIQHSCQNQAVCTNPRVEVSGLEKKEELYHDCACREGFEGSTCAVRLSSSTPIPLTYIVGPLLAAIIILCLIGCIAFVLVARQKRQSRGTYSPSRQEMNGARLHMAYMMKAPPQEGLI